jgi:addiction module HigA family antidote
MKLLFPARVSPPGEILAEELGARNWTQVHLAALMGRPVQTINEIIKGKKRITPQTALQLAEALDTSPQFWMNLETNYRLWLAQKHRVSRPARV